VPNIEEQIGGLSCLEMTTLSLEHGPVLTLIFDIVSDAMLVSTHV